MRLKRRHVLIGSAVLLGFAVAGFAAFALTGGLDRKVVERVEGDGTRTVRVALVDAVVGFDVSPDELVVEPGTHVVLDVVNEGGEVHDLVLDGGARTRHLDPGGSERLDLGVVWGSLPQLYCTLPGHRLAGMTLDVRTEGGPGGERSSALGPGARGEAADGWMGRGPVAGVACAGGAALIVGSSVAVLGLLTRYPALGGQALRYALAAALLAPVAAAGRRRLPRVSAREAVQLAALAATGLVAFNLLVLGALRHAEPAAVGVVVGCVPVVLALTGPLLARRAPVARVVAAALVVTVGAAAVQGVGDTTLAGFLLSLGALAGEALFSLLAVSLLPRLGPLALSAYVCAIAAAGLATLAVLVDGGGALPLPTPEEAAAIAYLAVAVTALAFVAWYTGVERLGVDRAGLFAGLIPVSTLICAAAIGTGSLGLLEALGVLIVGTGVSLGVSASRERAER